MKTKKSIRNMITSIITNVVNILMRLISQALFIKILGSEFLGLNGLFSNVISILSIAELGISSAIVFNLYKPIATNDIEKQKSLLHFYKISYRVIGIIIAVIGICIMPFLPLIINNTNISININLAYILTLTSTVCSYFLIYKRSILYANQKNYIINIVHIFYLIVLNIVQAILLIITKNYYIYLIVLIIMNILENLVLTHIANKSYSFLKSKEIKKLSKTETKNIFKMVKAMFCHKIGSFVVNGTDNILISSFFGLATVGLYTNYHVIMFSVRKIIFQIVQSTTASVGNLLVTEDRDRQFNIFKKIRFMNFWLSTFSAVALLIIMESFISIWIGKEYLLSFSTLIILIVNYYFYSSRATFYVFKDAAGLYYDDRFVPLFEALTNLIASIFFIKLFGFVGVILGTIVSSFWLCFYSYPKYVYKKLFKRSCLKYFKETFGYILLFIIISIISYSSSKIYIFDNNYLEFFKNCFISLIVPNLILLVLFYRTDNFKYFLNILKNIKIIRGVTKWKNKKKSKLSFQK